MLVLIPTAGIGSRLDLSTKNFNKSMIQLGDTPVISKIIDSYPKNTKFIIVTGYKGDHIKEYVKLVYPRKKIKFVHVSLFEGPGSGLTLSLKKSLKFVNEPFFFHANDSIFIDKKFYSNVIKDTMYLQKGKSDTMKYATVEIKKNKKKIHGKLNYLRKDFYNYTGVAYIHDFNLFKKLLKQDNSNSGELTYFKQLNPNKIKYKFIINWMDIGSKNTKEIAENYFASRNILPKFDQGIFFKGNKVFKFFTDPEIIKKRFKRSKILKNFVPKVKKKKYFYVYKYVNGTVFSNLKNKKENFKFLLEWLKNTFWVKKKISTSKYNIFQQKCNNFYYEKTLSRINYLYEKNNIKEEVEIINNIKIPKLSNLFEKINWISLNNGIPVNFHGDLHFENIIKFKKKITLLDWREGFADIYDYGDIYYDLAKINHGLIIDHKLIKKSKFDIKKNNNKIQVEYSQSKENKLCQKEFFKFLKTNNYSKQKVEILTAIIFLNIAALHHYPYSIFLYYLGKLLLYKSLKKTT